MVILVGLWIAAPAVGSAPIQGSATAQQATVDAAVQTLFAETVQPPDMTQTVAAAFSAAETATAVAISSVSAPVDTMQAVEVIELPLMAGPGNTAAYLAPDGERFAYINDAELCILDIDTSAAYIQTAIAAGNIPEGDFSQAPDQIAGAMCVSVEQIRGLNRETISWSPDGHYLVMTQDFFRFFYDADLWVLDTQSMTLTDITNDEQEDYPITDNAEGNDLPPVDICPRWMTDGRLIFLRYGDDPTAPYIYTVQPDGSDLQQQGQISTPQKFAIYALDISLQNQLAYNFWINDEQYRAQSGVWISDFDGSNARHIWHNSDLPTMVPLALEWSPDGQYIALNTPNGAYGASYEADTSYWRVVRVSDGQTELIDPDQFVFSAGWSPDGSAIVYTTTNWLNIETMGLYIAAAPGMPSHMVITAVTDTNDSPTSLMGTTPRQNQGIPWVANNTVMVTHGGRTGLLFIHLAAP
jgi:Tol biopolymer transport system component